MYDDWDFDHRRRVRWEDEWDFLERPWYDDVMDHLFQSEPLLWVCTFVLGILTYRTLSVIMECLNTPDNADAFETSFYTGIKALIHSIPSLFRWRLVKKILWLSKTRLPPRRELIQSTTCRRSSRIALPQRSYSTGSLTSAATTYVGRFRDTLQKRDDEIGALQSQVRYLDKRLEQAWHWYYSVWCRFKPGDRVTRMPLDMEVEARRRLDLEREQTDLWRAMMREEMAVLKTAVAERDEAMREMRKKEKALAREVVSAERDSGRLEGVIRSLAGEKEKLRESLEEMKGVVRQRRAATMAASQEVEDEARIAKLKERRRRNGMRRRSLERGRRFSPGQQSGSGEKVVKSVYDELTDAESEADGDGDEPFHMEE